MAKSKGGNNISSYSIEKKSITKGGATQTEYASAKVLGKAGKDQGRAPGYKLESC